MDSEKEKTKGNTSTKTAKTTSRSKEGTKKSSNSVKTPETVYNRYVETKVGTFIISCQDGKIVRLELPNPIEEDKRKTRIIEQAVQEGEEGGRDKIPKVLLEAEKQLLGYFDGTTKEFSLPLAPTGTEFQMEVWETIKRVPFGAIVSYRDVAEAVGNPMSFRAVGRASQRNPVPLFIPCHRVVGIDGALTGYTGGIELKRTLLKHESTVMREEEAREAEKKQSSRSKSAGTKSRNNTDREKRGDNGSRSKSSGSNSAPTRASSRRTKTEKAVPEHPSRSLKRGEA